MLTRRRSQWSSPWKQVGDTLWVLAKVPGERWRSAVEPRGRLYRVTNREEYRNAVLEAVDLRRRVVISFRRMPRLFDALLPGGLAVRNDHRRSRESGRVGAQTGKSTVLHDKEGKGQ